MLGSVLVQQLDDICKSFATGRRTVFNPQPIIKALETTAQSKTKQNRNITSFLNSAKYKNLKKQLEFEFNKALSK